MNAGGRLRSNQHKMVAMVFSCIIAILMFGIFPAESKELTATSGPSILSASEIDYPPFCFVDANDEANGFSVELMRAALAAMGRDVTFRIGPWAEVKSWLERGEVQALPLVGRTPEREAIFDFTFPYMSLHGAIVVRENTTDIWDLKDLKGRKVAVMRGDNAEEFLRREDRGIDIHTTTTFEEALHQLAEGRYEAVVIQRLVAVRLIQKLGLENLRIVNKPIEGFRQDFCFAVKEGDRDTLAFLNEGLSVVMADGTYRHLHAKWFAALELPAHRRIVIGGDNNYPPYEYLDKTGRPAGFSVDLTWAIARELGLDIEIRLGPWAETMQDLEKGEIDVIEGMFYSPERDLKFAYSQPYQVNDYVSVVRKGQGAPPASVDELKSKRIVVQKGDIIHDFLIEKGLGDQVTVVETHEDVLREVAEAKYDCGLVARISALYLIDKFGWTNLVLGKHSLLSLEYCYAVLNDHKALLATFSEGLKILEKNGEYRRIYEKWLGVYKEEPLSLIRALRYSVMVLIPLLLLLLASFLWSRSLRKQVARRTAQLKESEEFLRAMIACSPVALYSIDLDGNVLVWNASSERIFGWTTEEVIGNPLPIISQDNQEEFTKFRRIVLAGKSLAGIEVVRNKKDGSSFPALLSAAPVYDARGQMISIMSAMEDITERKRAEAERERLIAAIEQAGDMVCITDPSGIIQYVNPAFETVTGYSKNETVGRTPRILRSGVQDAAFYRNLWETISSGRTWEGRMVNKRKDGAFFTEEATISPVFDASGRIVNYVAVKHDITEQLRFAAQFEQAQRMESVGRLAGGVAHDFNNMLGVIIGYAELGLAEVDPSNPLYSNLEEILKAAKRSSDITRQLLAFARKQTIALKVLDLNETVESMLKMLRRLIGEDIDLVWLPESGLWPVKMDPAQIDQILANLCVNSRDAIAGVGEVIIESKNVTFDQVYCAEHAGFIPGKFVLMAVSDDGCGMDKETLNNIFEPFFTTKDVDQGTGLGLATVYGIVKQNNGFINVYSEQGKGTTFRIYLPRHGREAEKLSAESAVEIPQGRGETVLMVEDEPAIMKMGKLMLERLGYRVLATIKPTEALRLAEMHAGEIDLLMTDVVMPEMNGRDLADQMQSLYSDVKILFMSGYTANAISHRGVLDEGVHFIQKPFSMEDLAVKVRAALEEK